MRNSARAEQQMGGVSGPPSGRDVLLHAHGIVKSYGRRRVLNGVDLVVRAGEVAAIVGSNGPASPACSRSAPGCSPRTPAG
ncbi:hypothetical protein ACFQ2B_34430 [Streptomyces stramineus]